MFIADVNAYVVIRLAGVQGGRDRVLLAARGRESGSPDGSSDPLLRLHGRGHG